MKIRRHARTPEVLQMESVECGAAALGSVLAYYGRPVPLTELRRDCGISREGSRASYMLHAARKHGLLASGVRCGVEALENLPLPAILFWEFNHFVVLEGWDSRFYFLNDPACGHRRISKDEFNRGFTGVVLRMLPGENFEPKPRAFRLLSRIRRGFLEQPEFWWVILFIACLSCVPPLAIAGLMRVFVDELLIGNGSQWLIPVACGLLASLGVQGVLGLVRGNLLQRWFVARADMEASETLQALLMAPLAWYGNRDAGDMADRSLIPVDATRRFVMDVVPAMANLFPAAACAALMALWDVRLFACLLLIVMVGSAVGIFFAKHRADDLRQWAHLTGRLNAIKTAGISLIEHLKCGSGHGFLKRLRALQVQVRSAYQKLEAANQSATQLGGWIVLLGFVILITGGAQQVLEQELTVGLLAGLVVLWIQVLLLLKPWLALPGHLANLDRDLARLEDLPALDTAPTGITSPTNNEHPTSPDGWTFEKLEVQDLSFGYTQFSEPVVHEVNFQIHPGHIVALTGPSGCGKSTLLKLLIGSLTPRSGKVLLNETPSSTRLMAMCAGVVEQEIHFFSGPVSGHLQLGNPKAAVDISLATVGLTELLAERGDVELREDGANLSGGQRQRLEIARAFARNPRLLIFDEAFSGLEADAAEAILQEVRDRRCAALLVTHRPEILQMADEVLVMKEGCIVERGKFTDLSKGSPFFKSLVGEI